jgi:hypothetical protein
MKPPWLVTTTKHEARVSRRPLTRLVVERRVTTSVTNSKIRVGADERIQRTILSRADSRRVRAVALGREGMRRSRTALTRPSSESTWAPTSTCLDLRHPPEPGSSAAQTQFSKVISTTKLSESKPTNHTSRRAESPLLRAGLPARPLDGLHARRARRRSVSNAARSKKQSLGAIRARLTVRSRAGYPEVFGIL